MKIKLSILFICLAMSIFSQEKVDISFIDVPLLNVLKETETYFGVKFSFNTEVINGKNISFKKKECELVYLISEVERQTALIFNQVNERYYYITKSSISKSNEYNLLKEVLVTNYITSGINKKRDGTISILPKQLGVLPGLTEPDVLESLKIIPGVQSPNETATGIYIRGGTPNQNLVLWDGIKMYYSGHFFGMISAFNPYTTKEITLSKSGTGARYGNRVSGVIDIKTTEKIPSKITGNFGLNMTHADALLTIPFSKKTALSFSARRSFSDVLKTFTFNKLSMRVFQTFDDNQENQIIDKNIKFDRDNEFKFSDYTTKFVYKPNEDEFLSVSFLHTKNQMFNNFIIPRYKDKYNDKLDINNTGISVNWKKQPSEKKIHNIKSYFSNFQLDYEGNYNYIDNYLILLSTKSNSITDFGLSYNMNYSFNDKTDLFWGYDFTSTKVAYELKYSIDLENENRYSSLQEDKGTNNTHSIFAEYLYDNNNWNINSGIRFNYFSKIDKFVVEPRLYFEKKLTSSLSFKASFEQKHQTLSQIIEFQTSRLGFDLENQIWAQVNNENIPLQKSLQISTGILFNKSNWKIDIEPYYKKVSGMTSQTIGYNDQTSDFSNGKGKIYGIDILINKKFNNYRTWINYSYTKNRFKFLDLENTFFPANHDITNYFSWSHAYKLNNYEFSLGWIFRTGNPYTAIKRFYTDDEDAPRIIIDSDNINGLRLTNYSRLDASMTYSFNFSEKWKGKLGFSLLNIFNKKNILNRTYNAIPIRNSDNEIGYKLKEVDKISLGITPNFVFRVNF
ncbi:TonB-dependent receptor plug domain-containing protein [Tenacibaculum sp. 1B UA]|uniref:TonB-dependent receptor plug domain-containing protein n=1 Tax=Tenacibaculum sp. 1B UA TaxID=2922252 RepID=UPI002A247C95|nr:TonB-dependent receptor plug domain-containing protein [Tenacibaculum sp. 1B UA]MDX8554821.1 TonB-dependent receptor plug domain-containing protein [Tenacibaculum sp. 1B UA]